MIFFVLEDKQKLAVQWPQGATGVPADVFLFVAIGALSLQSFACQSYQTVKQTWLVPDLDLVNSFFFIRLVCLLVLFCFASGGNHPLLTKLLAMCKHGWPLCTHRVGSYH